jgi:hypothetical protein
MRILSIATIAGAALFVAACGGGAANNTANAPAADNGTSMGNGDAMAPTGMNDGMPADTNASMNSTTTTTMAPGGNTTTTTSNTATANHM